MASAIEAALLFVYSDGVVEQANSEEEQFGEERLKAEIIDTQSSPLRECVEMFEQEVVNWSTNGHLTDALSILAIEID
ncbi:SpoIIE family protein phosphatase [Thalassoroseus pseudoceratinae]|uniref:SpoIIE family protein phosphatase n=1 Tax=Thalassoroseus pseudoceratinae TaxID=2713176 RepID=UPI0036F337F4